MPGMPVAALKPPRLASRTASPIPQVASRSPPGRRADSRLNRQGCARRTLERPFLFLFLCGSGLRVAR
eukprot:2575240-Alexandrium_andersonii.AAC.1